eukprot:TRINITY_DN958_c0_g2_i3.p1 TRINITY_DN958_c0_g2~~TRINITY_DN958_c0_g2_i3.p1  ORF type:complete len:274 (-),score=125.45 TRINITY_DN958_c0_g2_i3:108-929(-)
MKKMLKEEGTKSLDICHTIFFLQVQHIDVFFLQLTTEATLSKLLGSACTFNSTNGGNFTLCDSSVTGRNLILLQDVRILQSWRASEWPANMSSTVKIVFEKLDSGGTEVTLTQSDVPEPFIKKTDDWWQTFFNRVEGVLARNLVQQIFFENASPHEIYELLLDSVKMTKYARAKCEVGRGVGSEFEFYDATIRGRNVELVTDAKIVQKWRAQDWPQWHFSTVTIEMKRVTGGTELNFLQIAIPFDKFRLVSETWEKNFWRKMQKEIKDTRVFA